MLRKTYVIVLSLLNHFEYISLFSQIWNLDKTLNLENEENTNSSRKKHKHTNDKRFNGVYVTFIYLWNIYIHVNVYREMFTFRKVR